MATPRPYGVLGRTLGHSYTPTIYRQLADMEYVRFEREPDQLAGFLHGDEWEGVNVTIPYKRAVIPYLDELSDTARRLGNVNTITRLPDGRLRGDNTDYFGFRFLVESLRIDVEGMTALVLGGSGGAGTTACTVLSDLGVTAVPVGRTGEVTYGDLDRYRSAELIVNCTPVGMYPNCPDSVISLDGFDNLRAVVDIVYNPARTGIMMQAEARGIPVAGGLLMLVAQAAQAVERYTGAVIAPARITELTQALSATEQNIALIGMPGSGKTRVGQNLARLLGRTHVDCDWYFKERYGRSCAEYITTEGEDAFRREESACIRELGARSGLVVSCGGGVVTRPENYDALHQNSLIVMLDRPLSELASKGRPITARDGVQKLAEQRMGLYRSWADLIVASRDCAEHTAEAIVGELPCML